jgi:hypothetical protein
MKNKQVKKLITAGLVVALGLGGAVLTAGPAFAASANTGAKSCAAGGAATEAESTLDTTHTIFRGETRYTRTFGAPNQNYRVTTFYSGQPLATDSNVITPGSIRSARIFCDL